MVASRRGWRRIGDVVRLKSDTPKSPDMTVAQLHPQKAGVVGCMWLTTSGKPEYRVYHEGMLVLVQPEALDAKPR